MGVRIRDSFSTEALSSSPAGLTFDATVADPRAHRTINASVDIAALVLAKAISRKHER